MSPLAEDHVLVNFNFHTVEKHNTSHVGVDCTAKRTDIPRAGAGACCRSWGLRPGSPAPPGTSFLCPPLQVTSRRTSSLPGSVGPRGSCRLLSHRGGDRTLSQGSAGQPGDVPSVPAPSQACQAREAWEQGAQARQRYAVQTQKGGREGRLPGTTEASFQESDSYIMPRAWKVALGSACAQGTSGCPHGDRDAGAITP